LGRSERSYDESLKRVGNGKGNNEGKKEDPREEMGQRAGRIPI